MDIAATLAALTGLRAQRAELDRAERALIESAREAGVGWAQIASALGLASRQAAEQRLLRLSGQASRDPVEVRAARVRQRIVDDMFGPQITELRSAASIALRHMAPADTWDGIHPRASLVRIALELAVSAPPGGLYELVRQAIDDSSRWPPADLPTGAAEALRQLALTFEASTPKI